MFRKKRKKTPKIALLEAVVSARLTITKLNMLINRLKRMKEASNKEEINRVITKIQRLQLILEAVALRLETIATAGIITAEELSIAHRILKEAAEAYKTLMPEIRPMLDEIMMSIVEAAEAAGLELISNESVIVANAVRNTLERIDRAIASQSISEENKADSMKAAK